MSSLSGEPIVDAIRGGNAPEHVRLAAARGALPIARATLIQIFVELLQDTVATIREQAQESLDGLGVPDICEALRDIDCPAPVLIYFSKLATHQPAIAECIAFHPTFPVAAVTILAALGNSAVIELVLTNQEALLRNPRLLGRLTLNPALAPDQRGRLLELLARADKLEEEERASIEERDDSIEEPVDEDVEELARLLEIDVGELLSISEIMGAEELAVSDDPEIRNAFQRIITLNVAQKAVLAMKGGREERLILIRDSNKLVSLGVLKNGRITDSEVEGIAKMRNVTHDVLRVVGTTREWVKSYSVVHALVNNPKTPQQVSVNFIKRLNDRDLKLVMKSREIPELVRRMAKKTFEQRNQKNKGPKFGK